MPKFLFKANYTAPSGVQGLLKDGGTKRVEAARAAIEGAGGTLESFYFAYGDTDVFAIIDAPDAATATAIVLTINASGAVTGTTVPLITPEEVDEAAQKQIDYRPPGA